MVLLVAFIIGVSALREGWTTLPRAPFKPIQDHATVFVAPNSLYVIGGFRVDVWSLDTIRLAWKQRAPFPTQWGINHPNVATTGSLVFIIGVLLRDGEFGPDTVNGNVWVYDPSGDSWTKRASQMAFPRAGSACAAIGKYIYIAGGYRGPGSLLLTAFDRYDTVNDAWESLPDVPVGRHHVMASVVNETFFVIGGEDEHSLTYSRVDVFDPRTLQWSRGNDMPTARSGAASGVINSTIIVAGGDEEGGSNPQVFNVTEAYAFDTWVELQPMARGRQGMMGQSSDGVALWVIGGGEVVGGLGGVGVTNKVDVFVPPKRRRT